MMSLFMLMISLLFYSTGFVEKDIVVSGSALEGVESEGKGVESEEGVKRKRKEGSEIGNEMLDTERIASQETDFIQRNIEVCIMNR